MIENQKWQVEREVWMPSNAWVLAWASFFLLVPIREGMFREFMEEFKP